MTEYFCLFEQTVGQALLEYCSVGGRKGVKDRECQFDEILGVIIEFVRDKIVTIELEVLAI